MSLAPIARLHFSEEERIQELLQRKRPFVLTGYRNEALEKNLAPASLLKRMREGVLNSEVTYVVSGRQEHTREEIIEGYLDETATSEWYTNDAPFLSPTEILTITGNLFAGLTLYKNRLKSDYDTPFRWVYIGCPGSGTQAHIDNQNSTAFLYLYEGQKVWLFLSGEDFSRISKAQYESLNEWIDVLGQGQCFPERVAQDQRLQSFSMYWCVQQAGEIVVTPKDALHVAKNTTKSVSITFNFFEKQWSDEYT